MTEPRIYIQVLEFQGGKSLQITTQPDQGSNPLPGQPNTVFPACVTSTFAFDKEELIRAIQEYG